MITHEQLNSKAKKQIAIIIAAGLLLLAAQSFISDSSGVLTLFKGEDGLYLMRPDKGSGSITLRAEVNSGDVNMKKSFGVTLDARGSSGNDNSSEQTTDESGEMSREELIGYQLKSIVNSMNDDLTANKVYLPARLDTGEKISWSVEKSSNAGIIAFAVAALCLLIYRNRYNPLKKILKEESDSITRQLPEFVNRLVLLLNAGLVLNSAFARAIEGSACISSGRQDYFYGSMREIYSGMQQTNSSFIAGFKAFAKSRRNAGDESARELMRISNIISDNISKGVELTDKLHNESELLWLARKRSCEERGRLAETKLTFPLTLFLLVLVAVTVCPALLEL
ncbi:MAG: hypothetical protein ACI4KL_02820 [Lentihominibacter sp.]